MRVNSLGAWNGLASGAADRAARVCSSSMLIDSPCWPIPNSAVCSPRSRDSIGSGADVGIGPNIRSKSSPGGFGGGGLGDFTASGSSLNHRVNSPCPVSVLVDGALGGGGRDGGAIGPGGADKIGPGDAI